MNEYTEPHNDDPHNRPYPGKDPYEMNEHNSASEESVVVRCCTCGLPITTREIPRLEGEPCCQRCLSGFATAVRHALETPTISTSLIPWLRRDELGVVRAFVQTVRDGLAHPTYFFARLPTVSRPWAPLLFALACTLVFYFPGQFINLTFVFPALLQVLEQAPESPQIPGSFGPFLDQVARESTHLTAITWIKFVFQFVVIHVIFASWIQQVFVYLAGGRRGVDVTLQVRCYSLVAMSLYLIPILGWVIGEIYCIAINALGLRQVHGISGWVSALAAISPLLVLWLLPLVFWLSVLGPGTGVG